MRRRDLLRAFPAVIVAASLPAADPRPSLPRYADEGEFYSGIDFNEVLCTIQGDQVTICSTPRKIDGGILGKPDPRFIAAMNREALKSV